MPDTYQGYSMISNIWKPDSILKVNTRNCGHFRSLSGTMISMEELKRLIVSQIKTNNIQYLSASGQAVGVDGSDINYSDATYLYLVIDNPTCVTGENIVAWQYRKMYGAKFYSMDFCSKTDFDLLVAKRNESSIGVLKFENHCRKQVFLREIQKIVPFKIGLSELEEDIKKTIPDISTDCQSTNKTISFETKLITVKGHHIYVDGKVSKRGSKFIIINPHHRTAKKTL